MNVLNVIRSRGFVVTAGVLIAGSGWIIYALNGDPFKLHVEVKPVQTFWFRTVVVTNEGGEIRATPDPLRMGVDDRIRWENPSGMDFRVVFENKDFPFVPSALTASEAKAYHRPMPGTPLGGYKYSLIFGDDILDPVIKVEEDPPDGGDSTGTDTDTPLVPLP